MNINNLQYLVFLFFISFIVNYSATISGKITDKDNSEAIADATVELFGINNSGVTGDSLFFSTNTDENGDYLFESLPAGEYFIIIAAEGFQRLASDSFELAENEEKSDLNFELEALLLYNLTGYIIDNQTEDKIPNASIVISNEFYFEQVTSDENGQYELLQVPGGIYSFNVSADGYKDLGEANFSISLEGTEQSQELDFFLEPVLEAYSKISGRIFFDDRGDPVGGAEIEFINQNDGTFYTFSVSTSEGSYTAAVSAGSYIVRCSYIGPFSAFFYFYTEFYDDARNPSDAAIVTIGENEEIENIDFGIPDPVGISTITISGNVKDSENNPIENAQITIEKNPYIVTEFIGTDSTNYFVKTDENGDYELTFSSIINPRNSFIVRADADNYYPQFYNGKFSYISAEVLYAYGDTSISDINFELIEYNDSNDGSISGRVTDNEGNPIVGAEVYFTNPILMTFVPVLTETDSLGNYEMNGLMYGDYYVSFTAEGFVPELYDDIKKWDEADLVAVQGKVENIDAKLDRVDTQNFSNLLAGKIKNADNGTVIQGAFITLQNSEGESKKFAYSDKEGNYEIRGVTPSEYTLLVSHMDFHSETRSITIANNSQSLLIENAALFGRSITDVEDNNDHQEIPKEIKLKSNYPNPFNPTTTIEFSLNSAQQVKLTIYNMLGQQVKELVNGFTQAGNYRITWDAKDNYGNEVSTGIYLYSLKAGNFQQVKKMVLAK